MPARAPFRGARRRCTLALVGPPRAVSNSVNTVMGQGLRLRPSRSSRASFLPRALLVAGAALLAGAVQAAPGWGTLGGNPQHTGLSATAAQPLEVIHWATPVDLAAPTTGSILIHYGSPLVTPANTVIYPVKTGTAGGFRVDARAGADGAPVWSAPTDYLLPPYAGWIPSYSPVLTLANRVYYAGAGGTVLFRDDADAAVPGASGRVAFYGLANYQADAASFDAKVFINTPITADAAGNIYFGFRTNPGAPLGLASGIARIDAAGNGTWVAASAAAGDAAITRVPHQAAPALSSDGQTLYVAVTGDGTGASAYLLGLDPLTLGLKEAQPGVPMRAPLKDPRSGGALYARVSDFSSASPTVGPDGDVYYGVLGNPSNGSRGWLLHFGADLTQTKTPGGFGWDSTAAIVPAAAVPSYAGTSPYLVFTKYNDYAGFDGGEGVHRIAVLDPNDTMVEAHASSNGTLVMKEILAIVGPTPDPEKFPQFPDAVKEWCINAAAVDPLTKSVMVNSEDGKLYRWDLSTNTLAQAVTLSPGIGEAYTSTVIGPDGTVYAINWAILNAVGRINPAPVHGGTASRKRHGDPGSDFDLALPATPLDPATEPRSGGALGEHTLVFTFDKRVTGGTATVTEGAGAAGTPAFAGNAMIVTLSGIADAAYTTVAVSGVTSGDGGTGGGGSVRVGFLAGDVDGDRSVTRSDLLAVNAVLTQPLTATNFLRDVNATGALSLADVLLVNSRLTRALPSP